MSKIKTPQEKKELSLKKDRRNAYGQNDKASRKAIPLNKKIVNKRNRRNVTIANELDARSGNVEISKIEQIKPKVWRKFPDMPLGEFMKSKLTKKNNKL